ncbi:probable aspartic proteinase GIP2 [Macadamia integrifolia]|uniref:probable aspartic proteinase GIP2 n=1 Tax=Macadamia integrifolia TaxID=60698 RepID=UPI001C531CEF|nr:probable aspartic proteinase GIP2 [Macadamia integrifolia]
MDASKYFMYTPLIENPVTRAVSIEQGVAGRDSSADHFVGVKSINEGIGGTKISTVVPYTKMETSIFDSLTEAFSEAAINIFNMTRVESVPPFQLCFSSNNIGRARTGPEVPTIDLVLAERDGVLENLGLKFYGKGKRGCAVLGDARWGMETH